MMDSPCVCGHTIEEHPRRSACDVDGCACVAYDVDGCACVAYAEEAEAPATRRDAIRELAALRRKVEELRRYKDAVEWALDRGLRIDRRVQSHKEAVIREVVLVNFLGQHIAQGYDLLSAVEAARKKVEPR